VFVLQSLPFREAPQSVHATSSPSINDLLMLKPHTHRLSPLETETSANVVDQLTHENTSALDDMQQTSFEKQVPSERPSQVSSTPSSVAEGWFRLYACTRTYSVKGVEVLMVSVI
jgi:hypothetical protein